MPMRDLMPAHQKNGRGLLPLIQIETERNDLGKHRGRELLVQPAAKSWYGSSDALTA